MGQDDTSALAGDVFPLSLSQQEVWLDQRAWPGSTHLNIGGAGYIDGPFDLALFRQALAHLVAESEALRLVPLAEGGQRLLPAYERPLKEVDLSAAAEPLSAMQIWWQNWMVEPFAFDGTPPWRFALLRYSDRLHGLTIQFHHLIMDGWGTSQVMQRWAAIYNALVRGEKPAPTSDPGYRQFVAESLEYRNSSAFEKDAAFWQEQVPVLPLPLFERHYRLEPQDGLPSAHLHTEHLRRADYDRLAAVATSLGATHFTFLIAVLAAYFSRAYGRQEVLIGLPSLNRSSKRYRETQGMFVGVFPLLVEVLPGMTFRELLDAVGLALKAAIRHQRYPISEVARSLGAIRQHRDSLFDVLFSFERQDYDLNFGEGRSFGSRQIFSGLARYPLGVTLCEFQSVQDAELTLEASPACFSEGEVAYLGQRLAHLMLAMAEDPGGQVADFSLVAPAELQALLTGRGTSSFNPLLDEPYILQFKRQAGISPQAVALVWDGGQLDYATLDAWSDSLAGRLQGLGAGRDKVIALAMERSPELVAAVLAVSKAGAAFLPLDPDAPLPRLQAIVQESGALALLVQPELLARFSPLHSTVMAITSTPEQGVALIGGVQATPGDLAYVLFTSGSTGRPKGVMVEHGALALRLAWISKAWDVQPSDRTGQCTQATFDPSLIELFVPLINGASIALPPPGRMLPSAFGPFAVHNGVTIMALVPSTVRGLLDSVADRAVLRLRVACCGGEVLSADLAKRFLDETGARLFNVYGPTETAIFATAWECIRRSGETTLPVGRAIDGSRIYVLDAGRQLLPFGISGEVYIAGQGVARGYLNQPETDRDAFFDDPFFSGERMYRTGDRGWLACDGNLHFIGRLDRQIKLRGYRIELGEIESVLLALDGVQQAAAKLIERQGKPVIHAWVAGSPQISGERIRQHLASSLPDYMLPSGISCLPELPLRNTGKIAYDLLPDPDGQLQAVAYAVPSNAMEVALLALWKAVLKRDILGVNDNFFDVGGDSLAAVDILAGIETLVGRAVPLFLLTENPTVKSLARAVGGTDSGVPPNDIMLTLGQRSGRMAIYMAASGRGDLIRFQRLADALSDVCNFYMLQPPAGRPFASISDLADSYAEQIIQNGQPGVIAGFSVGGIAALETARVLQSRNGRVYSVCLIDVVFPGRIFRSAIFWRALGWLARQLNAYELSMNGRHLGALFSDPGLIAQIYAMGGYSLKPYQGSVFQINSLGMIRWDHWVFKPWKRYISPGLVSFIVPGLHGTIFDESSIDSLAAVLHSVLDSLTIDNVTLRPQ